MMLEKMKASRNELLRRNTDCVRSFIGAVSDCNIDAVPQVVERLLSTEAWKEFLINGYARVTFDQPYDFITTKKPGALGWKHETVTALLEKAGNTDVLSMWCQAILSHENTKRDSPLPDLQPHGTNQYTGRVNNKIINTSTKGVDYALRRLRKDRPDIHARVLAGELTPHGGMVEAGFRKRPPSKRRSALEKIVDLLAELSEAELESLHQHLHRLPRRT